MDSYDYWRKRASDIHKLRNPQPFHSDKVLEERTGQEDQKLRRLAKLIKSKDELRYQLYCSSVERVNESKQELKQQMHSMSEEERQAKIAAIQQQQRVIESEERLMFISIK